MIPTAAMRSAAERPGPEAAGPEPSLPRADDAPPPAPAMLPSRRGFGSLAILGRGPLLASVVLHALALGVLFVLHLNNGDGGLGGVPSLVVTTGDLTFPPEVEEEPPPPLPDELPEIPLPELTDDLEVLEVLEVLPPLEVLEPWEVPDPEILVLPLAVAEQRLPVEPPPTPPPVVETPPPPTPVVRVPPVRRPSPPVRRAPPRGAGPLRVLRNPVFYPEEARRRGMTGTVYVELRVEPDGHVSDVRLSRSSGHAALDRAALDSVRRWLFAPVTRPRRVLAPVEFRLD